MMNLFLLGALAAFFLAQPAAVWADDEPAVPEAATPAEPVVPQSELDKLKGEWEAVREQQIQMIREKEDQLEKLKEEIFAKMKSQDVPAVPQPVVSQLELVGTMAAVPGGSAELEAQKAALQAERQKFFTEMNRQKESLRQLQAALDEKTKQLEADRARFELEKKTVAP